MTGLIDLQELLSNLEPELSAERYVFCATGAADAPDWPDARPFAVVREAEGVTLVVDKAQAQRAGLPCSGDFRKITLRVHSSLHAVGLTAAVAGALAAAGISANLVAGYYHDHVFVPAGRASEALDTLKKLACMQ